MDNNILTFIDEQDDHVIISTLPSEDYTTNRFEFFWYKFVQMLASKHDDEFEFITRLCVGNLIKNTIFYAEGSNDSFRGLNIYLDTPILFALLGMDTPERRDSYLLLVQQVLAAGCNVHVFDHNFRELQSIISSAAAWANSGDYDPRKANNAARFFHDSDLSPEETVEFVSDLETGNDLRQCKSLCKSNINHTDDACSKELDHRKLDAVHVERITIHREDMEGKEQCAKQCDHIAAIDAERFRYTEEEKANRCHDRTDPTANTDPFSEEETDERNKDNIERRNKRGLARSSIQQTELLHIACRGKQHTADHAADKILSSERRKPVRLHLSA